MFTESIKRALTEKKLTQSWLAGELGIAKSTLNSKLNSDNFDYKEYNRIKEILGIETERELTLKDIIEINTHLKEVGSSLKYKPSYYSHYKGYNETQVEGTFEFVFSDVIAGDVPLMGSENNDQIEEYIRNFFRKNGVFKTGYTNTIKTTFAKINYIDENIIQTIALKIGEKCSIIQVKSHLDLVYNLVEAKRILKKYILLINEDKLAGENEDEVEKILNLSIKIEQQLNQALKMVSIKDFSKKYKEKELKEDKKILSYRFKDFEKDSEDLEEIKELKFAEIGWLIYLNHGLVKSAFDSYISLDKKIDVFCYTILNEFYNETILI